ncbi:MAG: sn-glycerol-3-phosphate ABC transporter ATP-binding protein UgpC, partial [Clostridia bacterium]|nr:sn-glycerol-3-phosphate ABC transporter ATP-binding protein UgpC [Clostridia bacterium]
MAELKLKNIVKKYPNGFVAVKNFNLDIEDKEFIIFVGPSGCGKSTTLRMIAGLEEISSGELWIGDKLCNTVDPKNRDIAMVFQNYALYPHMTVYDNMAFALKLRKVPKAEIDKKVREAAKILDIDHLLDRKPKALSGGQRQRVAMGRAIVRSPKVFLMDEPLSNLDAKLRVQMRSEISKLHQKLQTTFIYVTHDQTEAMTLGTRIVVLKDGVIQQVDTPQNLYNKPENLFVAGFIGSPQMNFINATVAKSGSDVTVNFGEYSLKLPEYKTKALIDGGYVGKEVTIGIRPEDVHDEDIFLST